VPTKPATTWPKDVRTLAIDVGGSGLKASVLDPDGVMLTERVRIPTPYPCTPEVLIETLLELVKPLPEAHRVAVGFPGLLRDGVVGFTPNLSRRKPGEDPDPELSALWRGFDLARAVDEAFHLPTKVANDADVQGCAVAQGKGFEFVLTLGTGCGTALFSHGRLQPHLELGHAPFRKGETFEEQIGDEARKSIGRERWERRVVKALAAYDTFLFYDHIYIGGGNAKLIKADVGSKATIVPNSAGVTGGVKLWEMQAD
jgi:polyphosphate glucokinase